MESDSFLFRRSFVIFLILGCLIRVWGLSSPVVDAMTTRQGQTADAIRSLIEEPGFQLDSNTSWRGTSSPRIVQELPVYNILTQALYETLDFVFYATQPPKPGGADPRLIDLSGRLISVLFWALTFLLLQSIWSRFLSEREIFWANGVFVFAPLSVFFGQAVMPEMIFLAAATGFVVGVLRYGENPTLGRLSIMFFCALFASVVKFPAFSHLGLLAVALLWRAQGFRFLLRPTHWIAAFLLILAIKGWSEYVTAVNTAGFPGWTSESVLKGFIGKVSDRLQPMFYFRLAGYITAFILSPVGVFVALIGFWKTIVRRATPAGFFILAWFGSVVVFIILWGPRTAGAHSYYNLPMLIPAAMLFGVGMAAAIEFVRKTEIGKFKIGAGTETWGRNSEVPFLSQRLVFCLIMVALILAPMGVMTSYLFQKDHLLIFAANWVTKNVPPEEPVAIKLNHSTYYIDYMHVPTVAYYAGRRCFMLTKWTPNSEYEDAMRECQFIVETLPSEVDGMKTFGIILKGAQRPVDKLERAQAAGFKSEFVTANGLRIWKKQP